MCQQTIPSLVQIMACRPVGAKPLSEPMLEYCRFHLWERTSVKSESKFIYFHSRKCISICGLQNVILSRPQCVNIESDWWEQNMDKQRVLMHKHQGWNVRHGLCHIYMRYLYIWVVYSFCLFCCLFIIVTWWYMWCIVWQVASKRKYRHVW